MCCRLAGGGLAGLGEGSTVGTQRLEVGAEKGEARGQKGLLGVRALAEVLQKCEGRGFVKVTR